MKKLMSISTLISFILTFCYAFAGEDEEIGYVKKLQGDASIVRGGMMVTVTMGLAVHLNDIIQTKNNGAVGITFKDSTMISIGPDTEFVVDEYVYKPKDKKLSFASKISRGTLHFVSGNISKLASNSVNVKTPEGTIGLRGTRFLIKVKGD
jgi:hypothetical protein